MGWATWYGALAWPPILLFAGGVAWTIGYDTIYALQDKEDDAIMGVRSTARLFGDRTPVYVGLFYAVATVLFAASFWTAGVGWIAWAGLALGAVQLMVQVRSIDVNNGDEALRLFKSNRSFGLVVFLGLVLDGLF
jgi:4-hydroxybenzoate polyprenyltransferase